MNIRERIRGALRRMSEEVSAISPALAKPARTGHPSAKVGHQPDGGDARFEARRTVQVYSGLPELWPTGTPGMRTLPKPTPANLRRFAELPVARKAINTIKDRVAGMDWRVQPRAGRALLPEHGGEPAELADRNERIRILTENLERPNPDDSFRSFAEQLLEDVLVGGYGAAEIVTTGDAGQPLALWPVDGATIRMQADWNGSPTGARYVQVTGRYGPEGQITLQDNDLMYVRLNARTHTPFGLGRLEVAFETINEFLSAHRYAARLASNSVVQYALWLKDLTPAHHERVIRWWQDEIEGTGRVPILSVESKPEVLRFGAGTDADLRLEWQEFLIRMIANAFDLPPMYLGVEHDVNRSTAGELADEAFSAAVVPTAKLLAEHLTRDVIAKRLGWNDIEFVFTEVDARNELEEAQIQEILLRNGVLTVNEVRRMRGLPALAAATPSESAATEPGAKAALL
jgi:HK97 family phage portal protein